MIEASVANADLTRLMEDVAAGEEVVLTMAGKPVARPVPFELRRAPRRPGLLRGEIRISDDFDDPLPEDIMAAFRGERP